MGSNFGNIERLGILERGRIKLGEGCCVEFLGLSVRSDFRFGRDYFGYFLGNSEK